MKKTKNDLITKNYYLHPNTEKVLSALKADANRPDAEIAKLVECSASTVRSRRLDLEKAGKIKKYRWSNTGGTHVHPSTDKIISALKADVEAEDQALARQFGCSSGTVHNIRRRLEASGELPVYRPSGIIRGRKALISLNKRRLVSQPKEAPPPVQTEAGWAAMLNTNSVVADNVRRLCDGSKESKEARS